MSRIVSNMSRRVSSELKNFSRVSRSNSCSSSDSSRESSMILEKVSFTPLVPTKTSRGSATRSETSDSSKFNWKTRPITLGRSRLM